MKLRLIAIAFLLSGCSTVGNLEMLNGTSLEGVREVAATLDKTNTVLNGRKQRAVVNTGAINRKYGEAKGLNNRKYDFHDIPHLLQSLRYITE